MLYRIREAYRDQVRIRYVMGGLVRDMADFYDSLNEIRTTEQVAPHWREVSERSGQPIDERLMDDITDPHFSTWPACIAVKAAFLQGEEVGERYLRCLRRAALTERKIISLPEVYLALAGEVPGLDMDRFRADLESGAAERAFQEDLTECHRTPRSEVPVTWTLTKARDDTVTKKMSITEPPGDAGAAGGHGGGHQRVRPPFD